VTISPLETEEAASAIVMSLAEESLRPAEMIGIMVVAIAEILRAEFAPAEREQLATAVGRGLQIILRRKSAAAEAVADSFRH